VVGCRVSAARFLGVRTDRYCRDDDFAMGLTVSSGVPATSVPCLCPLTSEYACTRE
jgi:hypothetical protein